MAKRKHSEGLQEQEGCCGLSEESVEGSNSYYDSEEQTLLHGDHVPIRKTSVPYCHLLSYSLNLVLAIVIVFTYINNQRGYHDPSLGPSPARKIIAYETIQFNDAFGNDTTPYQGVPTDEIDARWEDLYDRGVGIRISPEDIDTKDVPEEAEMVPVPGLEGYYLGALDVFHQLHCLNMIRMSFYPERYNMTMYNKNGTLNYLQWLHMEILRQRLVCTADTTVSWYFWRTDKTPPVLTPRVGQPHTCRNFGAVREWAFQRWVDEFPYSSRVVDGKIVDFSNRRP